MNGGGGGAVTADRHPHRAPSPQLMVAFACSIHMLRNQHSLLLNMNILQIMYNLQIKKAFTL